MSEGWRIPQNWRLQSARYGTASGGLQGSICPEGHLQFPPREICPECVAIGYHGLRQLDEKPETIETKQFEDLVVQATIDKILII